MPKRKNEDYLTPKELKLKTLKALRTHIRSELFKMASLTEEITNSDKMPHEWRKKGNDNLLNFIINNRDKKPEQIFKKLQ